MSALSGSDLSDLEEYDIPAAGGTHTPTSPQALPAHNRSDEGSGTPAPISDLFGSDEDDALSPKRELSETPSPNADGNLFGSDEEMSDRDMDDGPEETVVKDILLPMSIPKLPAPQSVDGRFIVVRAPNILQLDSAPFSADAYQDILEEEHKIAENHGYKSAVTSDLATAAEGIITNTIRWRPADGDRKRESNARLVRWSDGSTSVVIGGHTPEAYNVNVEQLADTSKERYYFAVAAHERGLGQVHARMTEQWLLRPSRQSTQARSAVALLLDRVRGKTAGADSASTTALRAAGGIRASHTQLMVVDEAPELRAKREEAEEKKRERQRLREERNRERREAREFQANRGAFGGAAAAGEYSDEEHGYANASEDDAGFSRARAPRRLPERHIGLSRPAARNSYIDEDDDGFIVDDDAELEVGAHDEFDEEEEEELAAQRLKNAKNADYSSDEARQRRARSTKSRRQLDLDSDEDSEMDTF
ncbi:Paf1 complex component [Coemansia sp. RSA 2611]|nr:Paf1 complex component [Coemansia sp. RSA 2611]